MSTATDQPTHHWPDDEQPQKPPPKKGRLARIADDISDAITVDGVGGAMGSHIPGIGRNLLVDHRAMKEKLNPKPER